MSVCASVGWFLFHLNSLISLISFSIKFMECCGMLHRCADPRVCHRRRRHRNTFNHTMGRPPPPFLALTDTHTFFFLHTVARSHISCYNLMNCGIDIVSITMTAGYIRPTHESPSHGRRYNFCSMENYVFTFFGSSLSTEIHPVIEQASSEQYNCVALVRSQHLNHKFLWMAN